MKLTIDLNNRKAEKRFYKLLPLYKSFFFNKCEFSLVGEGEIFKDIEQALNIKNRKKRIGFVIDSACKTIDNKFKDVTNPCGFECGRCYAQRAQKSDKVNGCCRICRFQSDKGCTTKNVACKLYFCSEVRRRCEVVKFDELRILKLLSWRQRTILKSDYFSSRDEVVGDLYSGSIIVGTTRLFVRFLWSLKKRMTK